MIPFIATGDFAKAEERIIAYYAQDMAFRVLFRIVSEATGRRQALAKRQLAAWLYGASLSDLRRMAKDEPHVRH
jgi:hypothetical protein